MLNLGNRFKDACSQISIAVYFLACVFGMGAWAAINGLFVELAVIVPHLPEGWSLPSYLIVIIQVANIGPVFFVLGNKFFPKVVHEVPVINLMVIVGVAACGLLGFFWKETTFIAGSQHSTAFLVLAFFLAMVDTTSSVSFIPYMSVFGEVYLSPYFLGEGLSGLLPSLVAMAQGVGEGASHSLCGVEPPNGTSNSTWSGGLQPKFSPDVFFFLLCAMMAACGLAFVGLNYLPVARRHQINHSINDLEHQEDSKTSRQNKGEHHIPEQYELHFSNPGRGEGDTDLKFNSFVDTESSSRIHQMEIGYEGKDHAATGSKSQEPSYDSNVLTTGVTVYLLVILGVANALSNGVVPALLSYACIPYSYYVYHLTLTLSSIANPVVCFVFVFIRTRSPLIIAFLSVMYLGLSVYIIVVAKQSPDVILRCESAGSALIVSRSFGNQFVSYGYLLYLHINPLFQQGVMGVASFCI